MGSRVGVWERAFRQPAIPIHEEFCPRLVRHLFQVLYPEPVCVEYPVVQAGVNFSMVGTIYQDYVSPWAPRRRTAFVDSAVVSFCQ
jgi:hypothetical protein